MPGDVKSKAQQRFFGAVMSGAVKKKGLTKGRAHEILSADKGKMADLPERVTNDDDADDIRGKMPSKKKY